MKNIFLEFGYSDRTQSSFQHNLMKDSPDVL